MFEICFNRADVTLFPEHVTHSSNQSIYSGVNAVLLLVLQIRVCECREFYLEIKKITIF